MRPEDIKRTIQAMRAALQADGIEAATRKQAEERMRVLEDELLNANGRGESHRNSFHED